jgi:hypothetical protein
MSGRRPVLSVLAASALWLALAMPAMGQGRPSCSVVLRKMHDATGRQRAREADAEKIARKLGVDAEWVERCAASYGRHLKPRERKAAGAEDQLSEVREAEEFEELGREEREALGDDYYTSVENDVQDRRSLRRNRDADTINEWDPIETHEWGPNVGHAWSPYLHDDDLKDVQ